MFAQFCFDQVRAEAGTVVEFEVTIFDVEGMGHDVVAPGGVIYVKLLDVEVRDGGADLSKPYLLTLN